MSQLPRSLTRLTRFVRGATALVAVGQLVATPLWWTQVGLAQMVASEILGRPADSIVIDERALWLGFLGSLPLTVVSLVGLWHLWQLFGEYAAGNFFSRATQKHLRRFAWAFFAATLLAPVERAWLSVALSSAMPPGERKLVIGVSSDILLPLLTSAALLAIALVLSEAARIAEENKLFV